MYYYLLTFVNANGDIKQITLDNIKLGDTGWQSFNLESDFLPYYTGQYPKYRKVGKMVEIRGEIKLATAITGSATEYPICKLPADCCPSSEITVMCAATGMRYWALRILTDGTLTWSRFVDYGNHYVSCTTSYWLPFQCTFLVD